MRTHRSQLKKEKDSRYLQRAWNKYGKENFAWWIIENDIPIELLENREVYWIKIYDTLDSNYGYNLDEPLPNGGKIVSEETKLKMSQAWSDDRKLIASNLYLGHDVSQETRDIMSKNHADVSGTNNPMYGKTHSKKTLEKMSESLMGRTASIEARIKMSNSSKNKKYSDELILTIIGDIKNGLTNKEISIKYNMKSGYISKIRYGRTRVLLIEDTK